MTIIKISVTRSAKSGAAVELAYFVLLYDLGPAGACELNCDRALPYKHC